MRGACVLLLLASAAAAGDPPATETRARLGLLLDRLAAPAPPVRATAAAQLLEEGVRLDGRTLRWLEIQEPADSEARRLHATVCTRLRAWRWVEDNVALFDGIVPPCGDRPFGRTAMHGFRMPDGTLLRTDLAEESAEGFREVDFEDYCERALDRGGAPPRSLPSALFAYWAWHRGLRDLAVRMWKNVDLPDLRPALVGQLRRRAVLLGRDGAPRARLAAEWRTIARLDEHDMVAPLLVMGYERGLKDSRRGAPADSDEPEAHVAALVFRLRDSRLSHLGPRVDWGPEDDPARALLEMGWDAVPEVLRHLRDVSPTRGSATDLQGGPPAAAQPCTLGWTCLRVLEGIAGRSFPHEAAAEKWWEGAREGGARHHYLALLARRGVPDWQRRVAARVLLRMDPGRYEPVVRDRARDYPGLLLEVASGLDDETREALVRALEEEGQILDAATLLWTQCGDDRGVQLIADELRHGRDEYAKTAREEIRFLCSVRSDKAAEEVSWFIRHGASLTRALFVQAARASRDRRVLDALLETMRERVSYVEIDGVGHRVCDLAAASMVSMLNGGATELPEETRARNDALDRLADWAKVRRQGLDWAK